MSSVDHRIVEMRFDNAQFEKGVAQTVGSLDKLKNGLHLENIASGVDSIASKFSAFGAIGFTAIMNLTNAAIGMGQKIAGAVLDPLVEGGKKRALNIEQAKFQFEGLRMNVEDTMASALAAVKGTAFGLDEAAVVAANFGATGMKAGEEMTNALRGISGVAAMAGSSYSDIGNIFQKVAGQGRLMGDDLNRLAARGINAAATMSKAWNMSESEFRDMVSNGEVSFQAFADVMNDAFGEHATKANETYTGSLSNMRAALARIGAVVATDHFRNQRDIFNSLTPVIDHLSEALEPLLARWNEFQAVKTQGIISFIEGPLSNMVRGFQALAHWMAIAWGEANDAIGRVLRPLQRAFEAIFPNFGKGWMKSIVDFGKAFVEFVKGLQMNIVDMYNLQRTFQGFFAVLDIGWMIVKQVWGVIKNLFGVFDGVGSGILNTTGNIGDFLVALRDAIRDGDGLVKVFGWIGDAITKTVDKIKQIANAVRNFFKNIFGGGGGGADGGVQAVVSPFDILAKAIETAREKIQPALDWISEAFNKFKEAAANAFRNFDLGIFLGFVNALAAGGIFMAFRKFFGEAPKMLDGFIEKFWGPLRDTLTGAKDGIISSIKEAFGELTNTMKAMQNELKSKTLINIAIAIALLTASLIALSFLDTAKLYISLGAISAMVAVLTLAMWTMEKAFDSKTFKPSKVAALSASMILLSLALILFASAVRIMAKLSWEDMVKGIIGLGLGMAILMHALDAMSKRPAELIKISATIIIMAIAMNVMANAIKKFADLSWEDLARGLGGLGAVLLMLTIFYKVLGNSKQLEMGAVAMVALSFSMTLLALAVEKFGALPLETMLQGLIGLGAAVIILGYAMKNVSDPKTLAGAAAMVLVAAALNLIIGVLERMGALSWEEVGKSMVMLGGSLLILAGAMFLMQKALPGAFALLIAAAAIGMLVPALALLGALSWAVIGTALGGIAAALGILIAAGFLIMPALPGLLGLGLAILLIGAASLAAGKGIFMIATAIGMLAAVGVAGALAIAGMVKVLSSLIPKIAADIANGIVAFVTTLAGAAVELGAAMLTLGVEMITTLAKAIITAAPIMAEALTVLIGEVLAFLNEMGPQFIETMVVLLTAMLEAFQIILPLAIETLTILILALLDAIVILVPAFVDAGMKIIVGFLEGIANNLGDVIDKGTDVIVALLDGIGDNISKIIDAGAELVLDFINGIADGITKYSRNFVSAGSKLFRAIVDGIGRAIEQGGDDLRYAGRRMAQAVWNGAMNFLNANSPSRLFRDTTGASMVEGTVVGVEAGSRALYKAGAGMGENVIGGLKKSIVDISKAVAMDVDMAPTIRPVLDLTAVKKDAGLIGGLLTPPRMDVVPAYNVAASISEADRVRKELLAERESDESSRGDTYTFNQTNNSPKALNPGEVYRKTRNQISIAKGKIKK